MTERRNFMATPKPYTLKDGQTYYKIQVYLGINTNTGGKETTTLRKDPMTDQRFKTPKEAEKGALKAQMEYEQQGNRKTEVRKKKGETFGDVYHLWFEHYKTTVEETTWVKTQRDCKNHVLPVLSKYLIKKIDVTKCQSFYNMLAQKLVKHTLMFNYARSVYKFAKTMRMVAGENPFDLVEKSKKKVQRVIKDFDTENIENENFYDKEQLVEFLNYAKKRSDYKKYTFLHLLAYTGMRTGEAIALTWNDIDFENFTLNVNKSLGSGENNRAVVKFPKNETSIRLIDIDPITISVLKKWQNMQRGILKRSGLHSKGKKQLIFHNSKNEFLQRTAPRKWLLPILEENNLEWITLHGFRHTHCSLLFDAKVEIHEVQERLGHKDIQTTMNIYTHVTKKAKRKVALQFANYMQTGIATEDINLVMSNFSYYLHQLEQITSEIDRNDLPTNYFKELETHQEKIKQLQNKKLNAILNAI